MHLAQTTTVASRKRKPEDSANLDAECITSGKKRKSTPPSFFDTLSRQSLTRRTLREFGRRTPSKAFPPQPRCCSLAGPPSLALKRFARHGGPQLDDLPGYPEPLESSKMARRKEHGHKQRNSSPGAKSTKKSASHTTRSSAYDAAFEIKMVDSGFFPEGHNDDVEPENMEGIRSWLIQPRASLSPSKFGEKDFKKFKNANREAATEKEVMSDVFPTIAGQNGYKGKQDVTFNNLLELAPDIQKEVRVDFYDGSAPASLRRGVRDKLGEFVMPSTTTTVPILPNFVLEAKGPKGGTSTVKNQALHAGAIAARGMLMLGSFAHPEELLEGNAQTIASTYSGGRGGGVLTLFTLHPTPSSDPARSQDFHMTQACGFLMTNSAETFREGAAALRNARDWCKIRRESLITAANAKYDTSCSASSHGTAHTGLSQTTVAVQLDSDTSAD